MSLFLGLKESVSIPTGILWFSSALLTQILGNYYLEEIQLLSNDSDQLIYILNAITDSFVVFGATSLIISMMIYYTVDFFVSFNYNSKDIHYNAVRRSKRQIVTKKRFPIIKGNLLNDFFELIIGSEDDLKSIEYPLIQNIANNTVNKAFICVGTFLIAVLGNNIDNYMLIYISNFILVFQLLDFIKYIVSVERRSIPRLRLYYAVGRDNDCKEGKAVLKESVASKNWGFLKSNVEEINSNVKRNYSIYFNTVVAKINTLSESFYNYASKEEAIWEETADFCQRLDDTNTPHFKYIVAHGFGYIDKEINFEVWKATQKALFNIKSYQKKAKKLHSIKNSSIYPFKLTTAEYSFLKQYINDSTTSEAEKDEIKAIHSLIDLVAKEYTIVINSLSKIKEIFKDNKEVKQVDQLLVRTNPEE